jgi:predicted MFS family arabinose efflux permease
VSAPAASRHRTALTAGIFVVAYGTNVSTPFLVEYRRRLDLTESATVAIFVVYVVGIMAALLLAGSMSDRFGRRPIVIPMTALSGIASLVMIAGRNEFIWLLFGRFLLGVVSGAVLGVGTAWLLELYGPGEEQRAAVRTTLVTFAGFGIGPVISAFMFWLLPGPLVLAFLVHATAALLVIGVMLRVPETHRADAGRRIRVSFGVPPAARRAFVVVIVPAAVWVFGFPSAGFALFPVLVSDSISISDVAVAAAAGALTAWSGIMARPLVVQIGPRAALPFGMAMGTAGYVAGTVAFAADLWPLVLIAAPLLGAAAGTITVSCLSLIGVMADDARRGSLTSTFYLLAYPGMAMPLLITTLADLSSTTGVLIGVSVVAACCSVLVFVASRRDIVGV